MDIIIIDTSVLTLRLLLNLGLSCHLFSCGLQLRVDRYGVHQQNGLIRPLLATDGVGIVVNYQRMNCREFVLLCNGVLPSFLAQFEIQDLAAVAGVVRECG